MAQIPFLGPTYQGRSSNIDASRSVNFFPEKNPQDSKTQVSLIGTPGSIFAAAFPSTPLRALYPFNGKLYGIAGGGFYSLDNGLIVSLALGTLSTSIGRVSIANNGLASSGIGGNQIIIVDGVKGYIYNVVTGSFLVIPNTGGFP